MGKKLWGKWGEKREKRGREEVGRSGLEWLINVGLGYFPLFLVQKLSKVKDKYKCIATFVYCTV